MTQRVCLRGKYRPIASPFGGGAYVLTLACGHLWSWNTDRQGEFPKQVGCIHCDRDEQKRSGAEPLSPWDTPEVLALDYAVRRMRAKQIAIDESDFAEKA